MIGSVEQVVQARQRFPKLVAVNRAIASCLVIFSTVHAPLNVARVLDIIHCQTTGEVFEHSEEQGTRGERGRLNDKTRQKIESPVTVVIAGDDLHCHGGSIRVDPGK